MTAQVLDTTARRYINPDNFVWVVVGDAARVRPQLERLGMPIEAMTLPGMPQAPAARGRRSDSHRAVSSTGDGDFRAAG